MTFKVIAISGSLRKASTNTMALRAAQRLAPEGMAIEIADISRIPMYDDDLRALGEPTPVADLKAKVRAADAVLIATPEYNFSIPGVLKNALDWASRPPEPPFDNKPVAIMGAAPRARGDGPGAVPPATGAGVHEQLHREQAGSVHLSLGGEVQCRRRTDR